MALDFIERYSSTVDSAYTSGGSSLVIASATGLPSGTSDYYMIVQAEGANTEEVFHVTSRTGATLTVTGAQAGTLASNHAVGAVVIASIMPAAAFNQMRADVNQVGAYASKPSSGMKQGDTYRCTDSPYSYVYDGSNWKAFAFGYPVTEPALGDFSTANSPTTDTPTSPHFPKTNSKQRPA